MKRPLYKGHVEESFVEIQILAPIILFVFVLVATNYLGRIGIEIVAEREKHD